MENKKIVACGGTFNPPTLAHISLAEHIRNQLNADLVVLIPSKTSYMKSWKKYQNSDIYPEWLRLETIKSCETDWLKVDTCEMDGIVSGSSYDTVQYLKQKYETEDVYFAVGSDKLEEIPRWAKADLFLSTEKFIVMQRNNDDIKQIIETNETLSAYKNSFIICQTDETYQDFSSTKVRTLLCSDKKEDRKKAKEFVPEKTWAILKKYFDC